MQGLMIYPVLSDEAYTIILNRCKKPEWKNKYGYKFVHYIMLNDVFVGLIVYDFIRVGSLSIQVDMLEVFKEYRKQGIGSAVLCKLMTDTGASVIFGQVGKSAVPFLEHIGAVVKVKKTGQILNDGTVLVPYTLAYRRLITYRNKVPVLV